MLKNAKNIAKFGPNHFSSGTYRLTEPEKIAQAATKEFQRLAPQLTRYARALSKATTGKENGYEVVVGKSTYTNGKKIFIRPPASLAFRVEHDSKLCGIRDDETGSYECEACRKWEELYNSLYHEISHCINGSFDKLHLKDSHFNQLAGYLHKFSYAELADAVLANYNNYVHVRNGRVSSDLDASEHIYPGSMTMNQAVEDIRVDNLAGEARPGVGEMRFWQQYQVLNRGIVMTDGSIHKWTKSPVSLQMPASVLFAANGHELDNLLDDNVVEIVTALDSLGLVRVPQSREETFILSLALCAAVNNITRGILYPFDGVNHPQPPEPKNSEDKSDPSDSGDDSGAPGDPSDESADEPQESADEPQESADEPQGADEDAEPQESAATGDEGADEPQSASEPQSADAGDETGDESDAEAGDADNSEGDATDSDNSGDETGDESDGNSAGDFGGDDNSGTPAAGETPDPNNFEAGQDDGPEETDSDDGDDNDSDPASGGSGGEDSDDADADDDSEGGDSSGDANTESSNMGKNSAGDENEPGNNSLSTLEETKPEPAPEPKIEMSSEELEKAMKQILGHDAHEPEKYIGNQGPMNLDEDALNKAIDRAAIQAEDFDTYSQDVHSVQRITDREGDGYNFRRLDSRGSDFDPTDKGPINSALLKARRIFSDSKLDKYQRNQKSGRLAVGKLYKVKTGSDKVFQKKLRAEGVDFEVVIGMDISGSTGAGSALLKIKSIGYYTAELLHRVGVDFSLYAHTTGSISSRTSLSYGRYEMTQEMYEIKAPGKPWNDEAKQKVQALNSAAGSLDGHNFEFYRKILDKSSARKKLIIYFTDGNIPETNHAEEVILLNRELDMCRSKGYAVLAIGVNTDSPKRYGLDTVLVESGTDVKRVMDEVEKRLVKI